MGTDKEITKLKKIAANLKDAVCLKRLKPIMRKKKRGLFDDN